VDDGWVDTMPPMTTTEAERDAWPAPAGAPTDGPLTFEELQLAGRNRGMPLEALRYDITPTGLHYLLVHFDIPAVDPATWRLRLEGLVDRPLELSLDDLRLRPRRTVLVTLECAGNGRARLLPRPLSNPWLLEAIGTAEWTGTPLAPLLDEAGIRDDAIELVFTGRDRGVQGGVEHDYQRSLSVAEARRPEVLLVDEMNGAPLQPQHGFPVRLLVPGWYGMTSVKWLTRIEAVAEPFTGYQQATAYHYRADGDDPGVPVSRIRVRALMTPPGIPDFFTRRRLVDAGRVTLRGRAWGGPGPVRRVEVGVDGRWADATLEQPLGEWAWRGWSFDWDAEPGEHELACRATDADGETQPLEPEWNYQGMGNNGVQTVGVTVRPAR
jgi:DMSO/TMAO reductase YedYZ molybdopterin-dependent catalytic subunit